VWGHYKTDDKSEMTCTAGNLMQQPKDTQGAKGTVLLQKPWRNCSSAGPRA